MIFSLLQDILGRDEYETFYGWISRIAVLGRNHYFSNHCAMEISQKCPTPSIMQWALYQLG